MNNGYVKLSVTGKNTSMFVKRFLLNKYTYKNFKQVSYNEITFKTKYKNYLSLKEKSTIYKIRPIKYYGILKYLMFLKQNISFVISFCITLVLLFMISNTCFEIVIVHNNEKLRDLVKEELKENKIRRFFPIPNFSKRKEIIKKIIEHNKDEIEWLEIEKTGSKLTVKLTERKINKENENLSPRHIVAKKSGIIKKIEASKGVIVKKKDDYVNQGDIIVSGNIIKDEVVKGQVVAQGIVYAETWYKVNVSYPLFYEEVRYLDEVKNNLIINIFNKDYALRKNYTDSYLEKKYVLIKDKVFPFNIRSERQRKTKVTTEKLTKEEALKIAIKKAEDKLNVKLNDDEYIISKKTLNYTVNDSKIEVDVFFKVYENITSYEQAYLNEIEENKE